MTDLVIPAPLAEQLRTIAEHEHRPVAEVIETMIHQYDPPAVLPSLPTLAERMAGMDPDQQALYREFRKKLYARAREYWQKIGNQERLALTDDQLDDQFWLIDHEDIPRLKSEYGSITLPHDPIDDILGIIENAPPDLSMTVRERMEKHYQSRAKESQSA